MVINWLVPDLLKQQLVALIPPEVGNMLMTTRQSAALELAVRS